MRKTMLLYLKNVHVTQFWQNRCSQFPKESTTTLYFNVQYTNIDGNFADKLNVSLSLNG